MLGYSCHKSLNLLLIFLNGYSSQIKSLIISTVFVHQFQCCRSKLIARGLLSYMYFHKKVGIWNTYLFKKLGTWSYKEGFLVIRIL